MLPRLAEEFGTSVAVAGQLASAGFLAWGVAAFLMAPLSDGYGRRPVILIGLGATTIAVLLSGFAWGYLSLMAFRVLTAVAGAALPPTAIAAAVDLAPQEGKGRVLGVLMGGAMLSQAISMPIVAVITGTLGWRWVFFLLAASLALMLLVFLAVLPKGPQARARERRASYRERYVALARRPEAMLALLGNFFLRITFGVVMTYVAAFLVASYGVTEASIAVPLGVVSLGVAVGSVVGGEISRARVHLPVVMGGFVLAAVAGLALFLGTWGLWVSVGLGFLLSALNFQATPALLSLATQAAGEHRGTVMGLFSLSNQWGATTGSALGGLLLGLGGFGMLAFLPMGAALAGAAVCAALLARLRGAAPWGGPSAGAGGD